MQTFVHVYEIQYIPKKTIHKLMNLTKSIAFIIFRTNAVTFYRESKSTFRRGIGFGSKL